MKILTDRVSVVDYVNRVCMKYQLLARCCNDCHDQSLVDV